MKHFTLEQWADFARNVVHADKRAQMQGHLDSGCKRCLRAAELWVRVQQVSSRAAVNQPSIEAVRAAKAIFAGRPRPIKTPILQLLFDSSLTPSLAGARTTASVVRQLLYAAGLYRIDLRMEPQMDTDKVTIIGQVLNSAEPSQLVSPVTIALIRNRKVLNSVQTESFGEFQLECRLAENVRLRLELPDGVEVQMPLVEPSKAALTGELEVHEHKGITASKTQRRQSTRKRV